jgi:hypothetical protein
MIFYSGVQKNLSKKVYFQNDMFSVTKTKTKTTQENLKEKPGENLSSDRGNVKGKALR